MIKTSASITVQYDNIFSPFSGDQYEEGIRWVKENGFDGVEIIVSDPGLINVEKIYNIVQECNLEVATISTGQAYGIEKIGMTVPEAYIREAARKRLMADVDLSEQIGKPNVTIGLIRGKGGVLNKEMEKEFLVQELAVIGEYADKKGIKLNLEPINRYEVSLLNSTMSAYELLEEMGNPTNIGILYDTFHSNIEDVNILETIKQACSKISHVHLADSNRQLPGEGHIDFPEIIKTLNKYGYNGYVSLEVLNRPDASHIRKEAGNKIKKIFQ